MINLDAAIVPGESAAGLTVGQSIEQILAVHEPAAMEDLSVCLKYSFGAVQLWVEDGRVTQIGLTAGYRGQVVGAIGVGASVTDVETRFGTVTLDEDGNTIVAGSAGWCMGIAEDQTIRGIYVFELAETESTATSQTWQEDALASISRLTWSGFHQPDEVTDIVCEDLLYGVEFDANWVRECVGNEFSEKEKAERGWPQTTDCDQLDQVFVGLNESGIIALHNAGYTLSDGIEDVAEALHHAPDSIGYCFYHEQDVDSAILGHGLYLAFGSVDDDDDKTREVGSAICTALRDGGFTYEWDGSTEQRIYVLNMKWQRRYTP